MGKNVQQFGALMASRMTASAKGAIPTTVELGTINGNLSLTTGTMANIPRGQYMVDITLKARTYRTELLTHVHSGGTHGGHTGGDGGHTHTDGLHDHRLPEEFRALRAGDRVIVLWVGHEPIVVAIVESS